MRMLVLIFTVMFAVALEGRAERPSNVVLIVVDDLGWMDLSCQGSEYYRTPNIDRLAESGVRFTNAYAAAAICSPTRASIMTGKYPARLLLTQWLPAGRWDAQKNKMKEGRFLRELPLEEVTLAEALRDTHKTFHVGKWHLGGPPFSLPEQHGFDVNIAGSEHGAPGSYFFPYTGSWEIPTTGKKVKKVTLPDGKAGEYLTDRLTNEAISLIETSKDDPFFLYLPYYAVHTPLQAKKEMVAKYEKIPKNERQGDPKYAAMVESVDQNVGRLLAKLDELGLREDTFVLLVSDNGGFAKATDNSPLRANKGSFYEGGIRVPMIVSGPGVRSGAVSNVPVITNDLYPTIIGLLGKHPLLNQYVDGMDLSRHLTKGDPVEREALYWHYPHYNQHPSSAPVSVIRKGKWKLIQFLETGAFELYDLENDPGESHDLSQEQPKILIELAGDLQAWKKEVGADPMLPNPEFHP